MASKSLPCLAHVGVFGILGFILVISPFPFSISLSRAIPYCPAHCPGMLIQWITSPVLSCPLSSSWVCPMETNIERLEVEKKVNSLSRARFCQHLGSSLASTFPRCCYLCSLSLSLQAHRRSWILPSSSPQVFPPPVNSLNLAHTSTKNPLIKPLFEYKIFVFCQNSERYREVE